MFSGDVRGEAIGRSLPAEPAEGLAGREVNALHSQQHGVRLSWHLDCRCRCSRGDSADPHRPAGPLHTADRARQARAVGTNRERF